MVDTFRLAMADADNSILDALGETVVITNRGSLVGAFEEETAYDLDSQGTRPVFYYQESDLTVLLSDILSYGGFSYTVKQIETDGMGMGKLILSKV